MIHKSDHRKTVFSKHGAFIRIPMYRNGFFVSIGKDLDGFEKWVTKTFKWTDGSFKDMTDQVDFDNYGGIVYKLSGSYSCLLLPEFEYTSIDYGIVAHECMHIVHNVMSHIGLPLGNKSQEAYCYLIQFVYEGVMEYMAYLVSNEYLEVGKDVPE